jgi:hypothetical protein
LPQNRPPRTFQPFTHRAKEARIDSPIKSNSKIFIEVGEPMMAALREQARREGKTLAALGRSALAQYLKAARTARVG